MDEQPSIISMTFGLVAGIAGATAALAGFGSSMGILQTDTRNYPINQPPGIVSIVVTSSAVFLTGGLMAYGAMVAMEHLPKKSKRSLLFV